MKPQSASPFMPSEKIKHLHRALVFGLALIWLAGCSFVPGLPSSVSLPSSDLRGNASWYGRPFHGRKTANGETYNMYAFTAAHRTLPFGSWVRVQRLDTGNTVDVRINDRGPFVNGRVIDLSRRAAGRLGILSAGVTRVRLIPLRIPPARTTQWFVLIGGFPSRDEARAFASRMTPHSRKSRTIRGWNGNSGKYHVRLDGFWRKDRAERLASRLRRKGYGAYIVRHR